MKYFAKYLPVDGEIKADDKIFFGNKLANQGNVSYVIYYEDLKNVVLDTQEQLDSRKKAKLFLCSRDNPDYKQEILTEGIKEGQEFTEEEKEFLTLL